MASSTATILLRDRTKFERESKLLVQTSWALTAILMRVQKTGAGSTPYRLNFETRTGVFANLKTNPTMASMKPIRVTTAVASTNQISPGERKLKRFRRGGPVAV